MLCRYLGTGSRTASVNSPSLNSVGTGVFRGTSAEVHMFTENLCLSVVIYFSVTDCDKEADVISSRNDKMQDMISLTL